MSAEPDLIIRNAEVNGAAGLDVRIVAGRVAEIGARLPGRGETLDAKGGALIRGLVDHHIHLLATAAQADSLDVGRVHGAPAFAAKVRAFASGAPAGAWLRIVGYHERMAGELTRQSLDQLAPDHPVRVQHQTGSLWVLNSRALAIVDRGETPDGLERDAAGVPTGRVWRADVWLASRIGRTPPRLAPLGALLAARGVTGLMDASASTDAAAAALLAEAHSTGALPQRLGLMSSGSLTAPEDAAFSVGPRKVLLDDHDLPDLDDFIGRIGEARSWDRRAAVHCVTAGELALTLAAFEAAGSLPGDRIEHGGLIPVEAIAVIARLGLIVVTQPSFIFERGDRYLAEVPADERGDLYRCASLIAAGVAVALSSDAPYAAPDPWASMRAATTRRTRGGRSLGAGERIAAAQALARHTGALDAPGQGSGPIAVGDDADLCLLRQPLRGVLDQLRGELVAATLIGGRLVHGDRQLS